MWGGGGGGGLAGGGGVDGAQDLFVDGGGEDGAAGAGAVGAQVFGGGGAGVGAVGGGGLPAEGAGLGGEGGVGQGCGVEAFDRRELRGGAVEVAEPGVGGLAGSGAVAGWGEGRGGGGARAVFAMRRSRISRSEKISSRLIVSMSRTGFTEPSTCTTFASSKQRTTWTIASTSRMFAKNWFPSPSPFDAPFTRPAISTNSITAGVVFAEWYISVKSFSRSSGTATTPTFGSIVQNG